MRQISDPAFISVRPTTNVEDEAWLDALWRREWGGTKMIVRGQTFELGQLLGLIAWQQYERVGAATVIFHRQDKVCELMSLNAVVQGKGVGTILLDEVERLAAAQECLKVQISTTNDNLEALKFYQKRGYRLTAVYQGAVDQARALKPQIPLVGNHGIPLHDELELSKGVV